MPQPTIQRLLKQSQKAKINKALVSARPKQDLMPQPTIHRLLRQCQRTKINKGMLSAGLK